MLRSLSFLRRRSRSLTRSAQFTVNDRATNFSPFRIWRVNYGMKVEMDGYDDDLKIFEAEGALSLPFTNDMGYVEHEGARIWYAAYGSGSPVILLHGGLGHSGNWGCQVPALVRSG